MIVAVLAPLGLSGCSADGTPASPSVGGTATTGSDPSPAAPEPFSLTVTPAKNAKAVPVSAEIGTAVTGGEVGTVKLREVGGDTVAGALREDGSAWVSAKPLKTNKR